MCGSEKLCWSYAPAFRLLALVSVACVMHARTAVAGGIPKNLAVGAKVTASSQYSEAYSAAQAIDDSVPSEYHAAGSDWAVLGTQDGWFDLEWEQPVEVAQLVYYARATSPLLEVFKDYVVYVNGEPEPAVRGTLEHRRGPQRITIPKQPVRRVRIEFLSSHPGALNPGAAEIAAYSARLSDAELDALSIPPDERTLESIALRQRLNKGEFGFRDILLVRRQPLDISHVYVYHVEGYRPGGGLYVFTPDEEGGQLKCLFDAGQGMITTADLSYDGSEIVFALRRGGHVASNPMAHIEDISRYDDETWNYQIFRI
ncbi:MAG: discoidin domain-containing protein, partial [Planctomycetes bacterium]|nr:discoidin domain-containing protein [Planctomycetota bacterium]